MVGNWLVADEVEDEVDGLKEHYDVVVVAVSSYGEGEPPDNYGRFLIKLIHGVQMGTKPMAGMQQRPASAIETE